MQEQKPPRAEAALLFVSALTAGAAVILVLFFRIASETERARGIFIKPVQDGFWPALILGIFVTIVWPFAGWLATAIGRGLRRWAYAGEVDEWTKGERIVLAAIWPLNLLYSVIVCPAIGLIYRLF